MAKLAQFENTEKSIHIYAFVQGIFLGISFQVFRVLLIVTVTEVYFLFVYSL